MKIDLNKVHHDLSDSLKDVTAWMTVLTDSKNPEIRDIHIVSQVIKNLSKATHCLAEDGYSGADYEDLNGCECWTGCDAKAMMLFHELEKHFKGFWKYATEYKKCPTEETKAKMLMHFEHQLLAHDAIAAFVKSDCPNLNPDLHEVMKKWLAGKMASMKESMP